MERIRESGGHWWEKLEGMRYGLAVTGTRTCYGLIAGGELVAVLLDKHGIYSIGYYLCHGTEDGDFRVISPPITANEQTLHSAMEEAEAAYLNHLTEQRDYYAGLWVKYTGKPVNADDAPVVHAKWISKRDGDPGECSHCHEFWDAEFDNADHYGTWLTFPEYCPWCGAKMDGGEIKNE